MLPTGVYELLPANGRQCSCALKVVQSCVSDGNPTPIPSDEETAFANLQWLIV
jgi:hypothetical protein